jgi:hypothetical protein
MITANAVNPIVMNKANNNMLMRISAKSSCENFFLLIAFCFCIGWVSLRVGLHLSN